MKNRLRRYAFILSLAAVCLAQGTGGPQRAGDIVLPSGKWQKDEILKAEYAQNLKDARQLVTLSEQLRDDLEKSDPHVLSLADLKKTEEIEKLIRKIHNRLHRN